MVYPLKQWFLTCRGSPNWKRDDCSSSQAAMTITGGLLVSQVTQTMWRCVFFFKPNYTSAVCTRKCGARTIALLTIPTCLIGVFWSATGKMRQASTNWRTGATVSTHWSVDIPKMHTWSTSWRDVDFGVNPTKNPHRPDWFIQATLGSGLILDMPHWDHKSWWHQWC